MSFQERERERERETAIIRKRLRKRKLKIIQSHKQLKQVAAKCWTLLSMPFGLTDGIKAANRLTS